MDGEDDGNVASSDKYLGNGSLWPIGMYAMLVPVDLLEELSQKKKKTSEKDLLNIVWKDFVIMRTNKDLGYKLK